MQIKDNIYGIVELASFPELAKNDVVVKVDTGAYNGALHCSYIKEYRRKSDGQKVLKFTPFNNSNHFIETLDYTISMVRSSNGYRIKRYVISTKIIIRNIEHLIRIGLTNRQDMHYDVIIGRKFLSDNGILVDVRINQDEDIDKEKNNANSNSIKRSR